MSSRSDYGANPNRHATRQRPRPAWPSQPRRQGCQRSRRGIRSEAMSSDQTPIDKSPEWQALALHHAMLRDVHLRDLFASDPGRADR